ncbi:anthranilate synthase component I [Brockia lithotrophica]|uniref:Anthranilate synthase n=1 Tax=Brockia lithotrophica TaxID=933949 RepID=A0A660KVU1_9BACL|nr:anthranilate synthase component I [Brockia lithotrophica]RKQ83525.1 anthranilate synthase component I [Brockia lithotrophica]
MYDSTILASEEREKVYRTYSGVTVQRRLNKETSSSGIERLVDRLNHEKGALFCSGVDYTGRNTRWAVGFVNPPLEVISRERIVKIRALNQRGALLLPVFERWISREPAVDEIRLAEAHLTVTVKRRAEVVVEEERTKQPSVFSVIRAIQKALFTKEDVFLGLYGAFGYDLIFQFEDLEPMKPRHEDQVDMHLFLPDEIWVVDQKTGDVFRVTYDFSVGAESTAGWPREGTYYPFKPSYDRPLPPDRPSYFADLVRKAMPSFYEGDLFEVVPSQTFYRRCALKPSEVFKNLIRINPSPYEFFIHLGHQYLIGASPEMYVRVVGRQVETSPISGTIRRGANALEDSENIKKLLNSAKDEAELTMCTDVDRNDKSRICLPGSVQVIGRRRIEQYSHLFHTVDHIVGELSPGYDALDAFITHMWSVTVTGAPKIEAMRWIEAHEETSRGWYGGAVGWLNFNGNMNTGLTIRAIKLTNGMAEMRVGATVLYASDPKAEEEETLIKVAVLMQALEVPGRDDDKKQAYRPRFGKGKRVLLVDHEGSFVHILANYFMQTGAEVLTARSEAARRMIEENPSYNLVVLSPGPGRPERFQMSETIALSISHRLPLFGVCLGFQGLAEYFGGRLEVLPKPAHGEKSAIRILENDPLFDSLGDTVLVGRYHSLYVRDLPSSLKLLAETEDGIPMAFRHRQLPIYAVQFHPESILSLSGNAGLVIIDNIMKILAY